MLALENGVTKDEVIEEITHLAFDFALARPENNAGRNHRRASLDFITTLARSGEYSESDTLVYRSVPL